MTHSERVLMAYMGGVFNGLSMRKDLPEEVMEIVKSVLAEYKRINPIKERV